MSIPHKAGTREYSLAKSVNAAVNEMITSSHAVEDGKYPETIYETERRSKNNKQGGLTHITDTAYEFFIELENARQKTQSVNNGLLFGSDILTRTYITMASNSSLRDKLYLVISTRYSDEPDVIEGLYHLILKKYLPVGNNTYRIRLQQAMTKTRTMAHRKKIEATSENSTVKRAKLTKNQVSLS